MKLKPIIYKAKSVAELKNMLRKTSIGYQKQSLTALYLFRSGQATTRKQIAEIIDVDRRTIGYWFQTYASEGLDMFLTRTYSSGRPTHLTEEQQEMLRSELNKPKGEINAFIDSSNVSRTSIFINHCKCKNRI